MAGCRSIPSANSAWRIESGVEFPISQSESGCPLYKEISAYLSALRPFLLYLTANYENIAGYGCRGCCYPELRRRRSVRLHKCLHSAIVDPELRRRRIVRPYELSSFGNSRAKCFACNCELSSIGNSRPKCFSCNFRC